MVEKSTALNMRERWCSVNAVIVRGLIGGRAWYYLMSVREPPVGQSVSLR